MAAVGGVCTATSGGGGVVVAPPPMTSTATTPVTFVCCVESGGLEAQAVRLAASVRRWGGTFATCPFLAVMPRVGAPLHPATRRALDELEVIHIRENVGGPYGWCESMTKLNALWLAERYATTDVMVWLDTDTLMLGEGPGFRLPDGEGVGACLSHGRGATTGPGDQNEPWWAAMCEAVGLRVHDLPWVSASREDKRIRLHFNAGVFAYRRSHGLRDEFHECLCRILDAGVISRRMGVRVVEQGALPLAVVRLGLAYRMWPEQYNVNLGRGFGRFQSRDSMRQAHVLHYHDYMRPAAWPVLMRLLQEARPPVAQWLSSYGPIRESRFGGPRQLYRGLFKAYRSLRTAWYEQTQAQRF